jgi:outer membrane receptor protein involved in Fe transport
VAGWGENPYTLVHPQINYRGFWNSTITLGANNVLDKLPPPNGRDTSGFSPEVYGAGALGRFIYIRVRKEF